MLLRLLNFDLRRYKTRDSKEYIGVDYFHDLEQLLRNTKITVIDVGANTGDWAKNFTKKVMVIDSYLGFEPDKNVFLDLSKNIDENPSIKQFQIFNVALGAKISTATLNVMNSSSMNSILSPGKEIWGYVIDKQIVKVKSLDAIFANYKIPTGKHKIFLKIDTQGYDFEVLKGANVLLKEHHIDLVLCEVIVSEIYENEDYFHKLLVYMSDLNYLLFGFYEQHNNNSSLAWFDVMFISKSFKGIKNSI
jgi:FkbM family methyltransferase